MPKLLELQSTKEFASTFLNDIFFKMAVNRVLDAAPGFELVRCKECKHYDYRNKTRLAQSKQWEGKTKCCCRSAAIFTKPDDFCSYGERKQDK